ncbi:MAG: UDP-glucuronic acid decarboxylase family protein [Thermomicrobiales bacterium]
MNVLIAGGAGFIGSHLTRRLIAAHHRVVVLDNFVTGRRRNLDDLARSASLTILDVDVSEPLRHPVLTHHFDRVYHLASPASPVGYSEHPLETLTVNSRGTHELLDLAHRNGARFLPTATSEVYGDPLVHPQREDYWGNVNPIGPRSCYDEGKRFAESLTVTYAWQKGLDVRIARLFNTYGPGMDPADGRMIPNFCVQALSGEPLTIYGDGSQTRSLCFVDDTVEGLIRLMETDGIGGEVVNLGNPLEQSVLEMAEHLIHLAGSDSPINLRPLPVDDPMRRKPDIAKAHRLLGWSPTIPLAEGLPRTLDYFRTYVRVAQKALAVSV